MDPRGLQQYKEQSVSTMTQEELLQLLFSEITKRLMQAELALKQEKFELFEASVQRAIDIIDYLDNTLDHQYEISASLSRLYDYFTYQLGRAKIGRRNEPVAEIRGMVKELQETFKQAQENVDSGKPSV